MKSYAVLFPGQGSQNQDMLLPYLDNKAFKDTVDEASDILGYKITDIVKNEDKLNNTIFTQPIMVSISTAMWMAWKDVFKETPVCAAGHSLGEYSALVASNLLSLKDCLFLVSERAKLMSDAMKGRPGGMAAIIGLESDKIIQICQELSTNETIIEAVNFNSSAQTVVAGDLGLIESSVEAFKAAGAKLVKTLPVSVAAHTSIMRNCSNNLHKLLKNINFNKGEFPVIQNVDASSKTTNDDIIDSLCAQVHSPVLWAKSIENISNLNTNIFIEVGPGNVLSGLNKRIIRDAPVISISDAQKIKEATGLIQSE
mgnify:CR=1 FL=1|tara:strand:- start:835 stop:1770 length:936 start_codon:yes stop_codon:yes gene_type:complete